MGRNNKNPCVGQGFKSYSKGIWVTGWQKLVLFGIGTQKRDAMTQNSFKDAFEKI